MVTQHRPSGDTIRIYDLPRGGGATLIQCQGADVLLDTGNDRAFRSIVLPSLRYFGSQPDTIILSHPEAAHIGGGRTALQQLPIRQIISPVAMAKTPSFRSLEKQTRSLNVPVYQTVLDVVIPHSKNVYWEAVQVTDPCDIHRMADDRHAIHLLRFHEFRLLFLHDASAWDLAHLAKRMPSLRCDVMIMGRHQLHPIMLEDAIRLFSPTAVIATHSDFPASEKIPDSWNLTAKKKGVYFFHQGQTGMVTLKLDDDRNLHMQGFLNHENRIIPRPR